MSPMTFTWTGEAMEPLSRFHNEANAEFVVGQNYVLAEVEDRSQKSHNQLFALVHEAWQTLPPELADRFPSSDHLRKTALIRAGLCTIRDHLCASAAEASRTSALLKGLDEYAIVEVRANLVRIYQAQSMAWGRMKRAEFQAAKDAVLDEIGKLTGIDPAQLGRAA